MMNNVLQIENLAYTYPDGTEALKDFSLTLPAGGCAALVGPNGAGKTTLMLILAGFLDPAGGRVMVDGLELNRANTATIRARTGFLFQNPDDQLFMPTVLEDVCFGPLNAGVPPAAALDRARALLGELGLTAVGDKFPGHLSMGQKRLAALAGALATDPRLLVLDEPSAFLDPRARRHLIERLRALSPARLIVTHDLELAVELCAQVTVLDAGRIVAAGAPAEVFADEVFMAAHGLETPHILRHRHPH